MAKKVLELKNLTKSYKSTGRGAFDISFSLEEGDVFGLLGANGAGKTTVMKMLTGMMDPDKGDIYIYNYDIQIKRENALYNVGALIESPAFYGYLSGKKNLELAANFYPNKRIDGNRIDEVLDQVGLLPYKKEKASRYSLGMKQRLGLALAMLSNPKLYILDEPSNGLDIEGRVDIRNIIVKLAQRSDASFVICSHMSDEIQKVCNRVGVMKEGRLYAIERMDNILSQYPSLEHYYLKQISESKHDERNVV